ncbi:Z protein [Mammarenavirus marientalense]|uniref:RING finger protein Z n=1 Tax=Mammarenavirus marientalense TaxID=3052318 RepID=A0A0F7KM42_9VIRU|nr:Z protein [Mammarenavirus marientalense]AKH39837.1 Z protein [Mammarenavirus marientalense]
MGQKPSKGSSTESSNWRKRLEEKEKRSELIPDATHLGPQFCKSCWFARHGLVECNGHYLCLSCLTLLLTVSDRCPICKLPLPDKLSLTRAPTAPPPPPYKP